MSALETDRLILRNWRASDGQAFAQMNADPQVMEFLPGTLSRSESDALLDKIEKHIQTHGFGLFAAELRATQSFIGYVGLAVPSFEAAFTPCVEMGWRLSVVHWARVWQPKARKKSFDTLSEFLSSKKWFPSQSRQIQGPGV